MDYSLKKTDWEAYGQSIMYFEKEKNGDHLLLVDIEAEKILIGIVADGISNLPCDWLASELTCNKFLEFFIYRTSLPIKERIKESVILTNNYLLSITDKCKGLASTLSLIVWEYELQNFYFVNIGDSRIYSILNDKMNCLTRDDSIKSTRFVQISGEIQTRDYAPMTNYMGKHLAEILIHEGNIRKGEMLLLASDGFYEAKKSSFENRIIELSKAEDLHSDFDKLFEKFAIIPGDDMTALLIRKLK
jgi:serine/threonine protein phosphatase PrpC